MRVVGGGCSGLRYELAFDDQIRDVDTAIEVNGVRVILDEKSALYLAGPRWISWTRSRNPASR
jgi:iron-sulfur cluster assembly protein